MDTLFFRETNSPPKGWIVAFAERLNPLFQGKSNPSPNWQYEKSKASAIENE